jgi:tRNA A37 threonylcarbamoyladenosine synthetase subunit TsaC/SUA5/YrdC
MKKTIKDAQLILQTLCNGETIAYPTEGFLRLGCDSDNEGAVQMLFVLK